MASLAASTAAASLGVSEMLGNPLNFSGGARSSAPTPSNSSTFKTVALFSKKKAAPPKPKAAAVAPADEELAKWYGPDRRIFLPEGLLDRSEIPEYLNGEVPGDYGYDPFGLSKKPEDFAKYQAYELIHARWAMLGAAGFIIPEAFNKFGANCGPEAVCPELAKLGISLLVPSVQELAKKPSKEVPPRYVHTDEDSPIISHSNPLPQVPVIDMQKLPSQQELEKLHYACKEWVNQPWSENFTGRKSEDGDPRVFQSSNGREEEALQKSDEIEGFGQAFVVSEEQKLNWGDMFYMITFPTYLRKPHLFPNLPITLRPYGKISGDGP